jgi:superfamily II DNA or RNA helicase
MRTQLLPHNKAAYQKVVKAFEAADRTCVVHPTGTGKSYLMAAVSESYKNVLILGPNTFVLNQVHSVLEWRDRQKDGKVEYMTYSLLMFTENPQTNYDLICLDEFHRAGAPEWGDAVDRLLKVNPQAKVLGTTATPIRFLDDNRDMADELFGGNIASYMSLKDAWDRNILATPRFVTGLFEFDKVVDDIERRISKSRSLDIKEKKERLTRVNNLRLDWERSQGMPAIIQKHIDEKARRVIVFCGNVEHLKDMEKTVKSWFVSAGFTIADIYTVHGYMADKELKEQMDGYENDDYEEGIKIMLSVNMLNEGVHIPRINAVILLRTTSSKIIYLQQIGRCLTAANTDKPVILDMVDNITTTNLVHQIRDGYDWYEHQHMKDEKESEYEPLGFVVYDYTLGIKDAIRKLVPQEIVYASYEERVSIVTDFCEKNGRTPVRGDGLDVFRHYHVLIQCYGDRPEVIALRAKYGVVKDFETRLKRFVEFTDKYGRLPVKVTEPDDYRNYVALCTQHMRNPDKRFQDLLDRYRTRLRDTDDELLKRFLDFVEKNGRLPRNNRFAPKSENKLRRHVTNRLLGNPQVAELFEKYEKKKIPFFERLERLKEFVEKNGRLPIKSEESDYNNFCQLRVVDKRRHDKELKEIIYKYGTVKDDESLKRTILDFYNEHGRLPMKNRSNEEAALYKRMRERKSIHEDPDIARLLETRKKFLTADEGIVKLQEYVREHNSKPHRNEHTMYNLWNRIMRENMDDPRVKEMHEKYDKHEFNMKEYIAPLAEYIRENKCLPTDNSVRNLYAILYNIRKNYPEHPDVKPLLEEIASWPSYGEKMRASHDDEVKRLIIGFVDKNGRLPEKKTDEMYLYKQWRARRDRLCEDPVMQAIRDRYENRPLKFEQRYALVRDWSLEHDRLPNRKDGDIYQKYETLRRSYLNTPEVRALHRKYAAQTNKRSINMEFRLDQIEAFADSHNRLPSTAHSDEMQLGRWWVNIKRRYGTYQRVTALKERFPIQNRM